MKKRLLALGIYALFWYLLFQIARAIFIMYQLGEASRYPFPVLMSTFVHGFSLDLSATGYLMILPLLLAIPGVWFNGRWYRVFIDTYSIIMILLCSVIIIGDMGLYDYWGYRMDLTPLVYMKTPKSMMASLTTWQIVLFLMAIILLSLFFLYIYFSMVRPRFKGFERSGVITFCVLILLFGSLILPIRGGTGVAPVNLGWAYFHNDPFPNHAAINEIWNLGNSLVTHQPKENPFTYGDEQIAENTVSSLTKTSLPPDSLLKIKRPNILIFILESFSSFLIGPLGGDSVTTPNINRWTGEGILFTNFYSTGVRTDKSVPGILCGYPSQPITIIMRNPKKSQSLPSLPRILGREGYRTSFWYGGDIDFANMRSFMHNIDFQEVITKDNFDRSQYNSKWGVHDHVLLEKLIDSLDASSKPFFNVTLTLSSHEPFEIPTEPVFTGNDRITLFRNSVHYTDQSIGNFLSAALSKPWWDNTLVILVSDHCWRLPGTPAFAPENFHIFMLWTGGAVAKKGTMMDKISSQVDIPVTLLHQLGLDSAFPFGKDLFSPDMQPFAFYAYNEGFGMVLPGNMAVYSFNKKDLVYSEGDDPRKAEQLGKAYLQVLFNDYLLK
jgi:phosphoglycerol transferase MdoB-like AlkP superfamily enzyme